MATKWGVPADTSVRGTCNTPAPFVDRVTSALGQLAATIAASANPHSDEPARTANGIHRLASHLSTIDLRDPRLYALMSAYHVLRDPSDPGWLAGPEQRRVLSGLGRGIDVDVELTELATAGVEDVTMLLRQRAELLELENATLRATIDRLSPYRLQAAQDDVARLGAAHMTSPMWRQSVVAQELGVAQGELREAQAAESVAAPEAVLPPAEPVEEKLPTGIRRRDSGALQIFFRDAAGKQQQQGGFQTVEAAVEARNARLAEVATRRLRKEKVGV
jgi:hypothetical protein